MSIKSSILSRALACAASSVVIAAVAPALAQEQNQQINIEAQSLGSAVNALARQTGAIIIAPSELVEGKTSQALSGTFTAEAALARLLAGSGLEARRDGSGNFVVRRVAASAAGAGTDGQPVSSSIDQIVVTGHRSANTSAIAAKRNAVGIVDGVSQDTIGLLPDLDISNIARRIPGVTSLPTEGINSDRSPEASRNVVIRGLDPSFNLTTLDGVPVASADENERAAELSLFPPSAIARVEAIKTLTSDLDPHGLSGQLNLVTFSALNRNEPFTAVRASVGADSSSGDYLEDFSPNFRADVLHAQQFGDDGAFGLVVAASFEEFSQASRSDRWTSRGDALSVYRNDAGALISVPTLAESNGLVAARSADAYLIDTNQQRASGVLKLEYSPSQQTTASILGAVFAQEEDETRHQYLLVGDVNSLTNQVGKSGRWSRGFNQVGFVDQPEESTTYITIAELDHSFENGDSMKLTGSFSSAEVTVNRLMSKFSPTFLASQSFSYFFEGDRPAFVFDDPASANNYALQPSSYIRDIDERSTQDLVFINGRYQRNFDATARGIGFQVGTSYTGRDQEFDREYIEGDVFSTVGCTQTDVRRCPLATFNNYALGPLFDGLAADVPFAIIDDARMRADWRAQGRPITNDRTDDAKIADYEIAERTLGGFAQVSFRTDRLHVLGGLRYDQTDADIELFAQDDALVPGHVLDSDYVAPLSRTTSYENWLPSILGTVELSDTLVLRAAYGRSLGRPNFSELARAERVGVPDETLGAINIERGNPDLRPLISDNFDLSIEHYADGGMSLLAMAAFYKDVTDLIFVQTTTQPNFSFEGNSYTATITQPVNTSDAYIYGLELSVRKDFARILPAPFDGLILDANLTWLNSGFSFLLPNGQERVLDGWESQPELLANISLAYEGERLSGKIAYNWLGEYIAAVSSDPLSNDSIAKSRGVVDFQVRYALSPNFSLLVEAENVFEEGLDYWRRVGGSVGDLDGGNVTSGRTVWFGVSANF